MNTDTLLSNISGQFKLRHSMIRLIQHNFFRLSFLTITTVVLPSSVLAEPVIDSMFSCQAQGLSGITPTITVGSDHGTNLSFVRTKEVIKKVWLDDPSRLALDFDGSLCTQLGDGSDKGGNGCENSSATVIHLRRIKPLLFPNQISNSQGTLITVITEGVQGRKIYPFRIVYSNIKPKYTTLMIFPDPIPRTDSCARLP